MTGSQRFARVACLLAMLALLGSCGDDRGAEIEGGRIIVLGFDGMDPNLARQWMDDGSLPNFKRLAEQGSFRPLGTSNPPQSPVAWASFATGLNPGQHGIYDFLRRDAETYAPDFSISRLVPPESTLDLFGMSIPLDSGQIINRRQGEPFWNTVEQADDGRATILRVPVTYPPDPIHRMLSGMGVPDLLGTQGTYTLYTTRPARQDATSSATRSIRVRPDRQGRIETTLEGPMDPLDSEPQAMTLPLVLEPIDGGGVRVTLDGVATELQAGEWSDFITVNFKYLPLTGVSGIVRLHLVEDYPRVQLYVSPIQIDPRAPVVPISSPSSYAADLVERIGLYHTIGMPEETWSLNEGHISDAAYLDMIRAMLAEREAMFYDALDARDSQVVTGVFVQTDRVSHMFYRGLDTEHPLYPETDEIARGAIHWIYREADRVLGETLSRMGPGDRLLVLSDHGFSPFRWAVNLNRWLVDNGYLVLEPGRDAVSPGFGGVDWSKTRAYALGLNGLFLNLAGRESQGIVEAADVAALKSELQAGLAAWVDQGTGLDVVREVFDGDEVYEGNANGDKPDLVVGYEPGLRASWQTTLGGAPLLSLEPNDRKWSGDHCVTPEAVPGVLFTSFPLPEGAIPDIGAVAPWILEHWQQP